MINLLVTYDVNTLTKEGRRRLRRVAKICEGFGQRVQLSVFEISVTETQKEILRHRLKKAIDPSLDSLRIYTLVGSRANVVEAHGRDQFIDYTEPLIV
jgi:CRISPR-associated protein Cas2